MLFSVSDIERTKPEKIEVTGKLRRFKEIASSNKEERAERHEGGISCLKTRLKRFAISLAFLAILPMAGTEQYPSRTASLFPSSNAFVQTAQTLAANSQNQGTFSFQITPSTQRSAPSKASEEISKSQRVFQLNDTVKIDKGRVTVSWEDSDNNFPYEVSYRYAGNGAFEEDYFWGNGNEQNSTTTRKSFVIESLAPGETYEIRIEDCDGTIVSHIYTLPEAATFVDEGLKASAISVKMSPVQKEFDAEYSTASEIDALIAKDIISNMGKIAYGVSYDADYPELKNPRTYFTQLFITAPNGFTCVEVFRNADYEKGFFGYYLIGDTIFQHIFDQAGDIPIGTWKVDLYWDGMHVNRSAFEVQSSAPQRVFQLNDTVEIDRGQVTVNWKDSYNNSPYKVYYQYAGNGAIGAQKYTFWVGEDEEESTTFEKSFTIKQLIPGKTYEVFIEDCNGKTISHNYALPVASTFTDEDIEASEITVLLHPVQKNVDASYSTASEIDAFIAKDIISNMGQLMYGLSYDIFYPELKHSRTYYTQVSITAPSGYTQATLWGDRDFENGYLGYYMIGDSVFQYIYDKTGDIPTGLWKVDLYLDGMHVSQNTFEVLKNAPTIKPTATPTPRPTATPKPTATPTPRPTATPKPTATPTPRPAATPQRVFRLNSTIKTYKGQVTISWEDSENNSPYSVSYEYVGKSNTVQSRYEVSGGKTYSKSITTGELIPGKTYKIGVTDCNGKTIYDTYSLPTPSSFVDGLLKASSIKVKIEPRQKNDSASDKTASSISAIRAADIISNRGIKEYGFRYSIDYPKLAHSRSYYTQIAITAPNDFLECEVNGDAQYGAEYSGQYYYMLGEWTFWKIYNKNSSIPKGTWKVDLYWDGMHVNQSTFEVQ